MFNFNLKKTAIYQAVKLEKFPVFKFAKILKKLFFALFIFISILFIYGFFPNKFSKETCRTILGFLIISLVLSLSSWLIQGFFELKIKRPNLRSAGKRGYAGKSKLINEAVLDPERFNLAEFLNFESAKAVSKSIKSAGQFGVTSTSLLYYLLFDNPKLKFIFSRLLLDVKEIRKALKEVMKNYPPSFFKKVGDNSVIFTPLEVNGSKKKHQESKPLTGFTEDFQEAVIEALKRAQGENHTRIEIGDILSALAKVEPILKQILIKNKLKSEDIENLICWLENIEDKKKKKFWDYENLAKRGTLAKEWTSGYTITLDRFSIDLTEVVRQRDIDVVGHKAEIKMMERILSRGELNNALIIGEDGTGRKSMVYDLAKKSLLGKSLPRNNYKRVVELDMPALLAQIKEIEEVESILDVIFHEAVTAGNIILVIDELHNYIGQDVKPGIVDISGIIVPYLRLPQLQIVALTTYEGLHRYIEKNPSILSLFGKVEVSGISQRETLVLLEYLTFSLEQKHNIFISYPAVREIIYLTDRYFPSLSFPEKAINILNEVAVYVASAIQEKVVLPKHVAKIITERTEIPVGEIESKERDILLNLENLIHQRIIDQAEAVKEVSTALRRARSEVTIRNGPMGCFLFLGPTGVGKTETSKALAEFYFGSEKRMIRLDMSEFQDIKDIPRLIGSETEIGLLTTPVREDPFSLILLDELEKANLNILNLFLQVFDEGHLTDGFGRKVDFKNTIIIATSNAGYQVILEALKAKSEWSEVKQRLLDYLFEKMIFRPEFINRFDAVVVFRSLSKKDFLSIAELMLGKLKKNLEEKGIEFVITESLKEKIAELGYSPVFGAREMRRVIQDKVENVLAIALLSKQLVRGNKVEFDQKDFKLIINP